MRKMLLATALAAGLATTANAATEHFTAKLSAANESPSNTSKGTGMVDLTLNTSTHQGTYTITYENLSGPAMAAHFHGPAEQGKNAGVLVPVAGEMASPIKGEAKFTAEQEKDLQAGRVYLNIHTAANKDGEVRGQLEKAK